MKSLDGSRQQTTLTMMTRHETIQFDYPAMLYGINLRPPSFNSIQKPLKLIVGETVNVDRLFVFGSESIGILFIDKDMDIYITQPVYEQILANYYSLLELRVSYDDIPDLYKFENNVRIVDLNCPNFEQLKKNVRFITYNEEIILNELSIKCKSSGVHVGWCTFVCSFDSKTVHISNKLTSRRKFGIRYENIKVDYDININDVQPNKYSIDDFNSIVANSKTLVIACDIPTTGVDLLFHLPFLFKKNAVKVPISVQFKNFKEYINNLSNHTDWLEHPINIQNIFDNVSFVEDIRQIKKNTITIIDKNCLYGMNCEDMNILTVGELISKPKLNPLTHEDSESYFDSCSLENYILPLNKFEMLYDEIYSIDLDAKNTLITLTDSIKDINKNLTYFYGHVLNSDRDSPDIINCNFENSSVELLCYLFNQEEYFQHDEHYFFPKYRIKVVQTKEGSYKISKCQ